VLFGGNAGDLGFPLADTWEWDGNQWTLHIPETSPPARSFAGMVYDGARKRVVLFGGRSSGQTVEFLDDTWEWDGTTWTELATTTKPPARTAHVMGYDPKRNVIVVAGGIGLGVVEPDATCIGLDVVPV